MDDAQHAGLSILAAESCGRPKLKLIAMDAPQKVNFMV
jgi:hypothetical protein